MIIIIIIIIILFISGKIPQKKKKNIYTHYDCLSLSHRRSSSLEEPCHPNPDLKKATRSCEYDQTATRRTTGGEGRTGVADGLRSTETRGVDLIGQRTRQTGIAGATAWSDRRVL